ncbi:hypothetical protein BKA63DRAFT_566384 [Paraphoma chrysanthemicola]|nr:hypothetical protein BKA63DRAFT_566384 [Paraphoma chrysanthemicola]
MASTTTLTSSDMLKSVQGLQGSILVDGSSFTVVDCESGIAEMIDTLAGLPVQLPSIYLYLLPKDYTYLIDVHQLQQKAFSTTGKQSDTCLEAILEAKDIPNVFFDVRNDSDALFHHFQISLSGVHDIQLMELATRSFPRKVVNGLQRCIQSDAVMTVAEKSAWNAAKEEGMKLFAPERGGSYEVFNDRPLRTDIIQYCVQDVQFLPRLWSRYQERMSASWAIKVQIATEERVSLSQSKDYEPHGKHKAMPPAGWYTKPGSSARRIRRLGQF